MKNIKKLVKTLAAVSTIGLGFATVSVGQAQAASLVPNQEGEIQLTNTDLQCLDPSYCIDTTSLDFGYSVTSLEYDTDGKGPQFGKSRLFVDDRSTSNDGSDGFDLNQFGITFLGEDEGTNPHSGTNWFRTVAYEEGSTTPFENGRLEVGRFKFNFNGKTASEVRLDFFDVEDSGFSGILKVNGADVNPNDFLLDGGEDGNTQTLVLKDVSSFVVQLGNVNSSQFATGDGVNLAVSVPESETSIALSLVAVAGVLTLKRRKKASHKA